MSAPTTAIDLVDHPLARWNGPLGLPEFSAIDDADFAPAFDAALAAHAAEIEAIASSGEVPTIDNTLAALELAGEPLSRISAIFWCRAGAHTNDVIRAEERRIAPKMSRHFSSIYMNETLFSRIDRLHSERDSLGLDSETLRVLEKTWKSFVRAGAKLDPAQKEQLAATNEELASLGARFGQNVLADESGWSLMLDKQDLTGLPEFVQEAMAAAAAERGAEGKYAVTLSRSIIEPFLSFAARRDLREKAFVGFTGRGEASNWEIVKRMLELRAEKARLLGYESYAALKLDDTMAKTPDAVMGLLDPVWERARARALADKVGLQQLAAETGSNDEIEAHDWRYYAEKLRAERYAFDEAELKPYLQLDRMIEAAFDVAGRLFGLRFEEVHGIAGWHPEMRAFKVMDADGAHRGAFLADYFARGSKRSGAWMSRLQSGYSLGPGSKPIIYNITNFAKPQKGQPALLSLDEARTLFHEFGHALHGLLSDVTWPSVSGTSVSRDFVELPSQLYEHWLTAPEILEKHALHYRTQEPMPAGLVEKMKAARNFNAGFAAVEYTSSALVDMAYHAAPEAPADPKHFEAETLERLGMPDAMAMRHASPHFTHVFSGDGYSAGYYSYMWSEVLDSDAFDAFEATGNLFDPELAEKLKRHIYAAGGSANPEALYTAFRGRMPSPQAMLKKRGLHELTPPMEVS